MTSDLVSDNKRLPTHLSFTIIFSLNNTQDQLNVERYRLLSNRQSLYGYASNITVYPQLVDTVVIGEFIQQMYLFMSINKTQL